MLGNRDKRDAGVAALRAEVDRLARLPLTGLATTREQRVQIVGEGLQVLEHACLIRQQVVLVGNEHWALGWTITRVGGAALADGTVGRSLGAQ